MFWSPTENSPDDKPDFRKQFIIVAGVTVFSYLLEWGRREDKVLGNPGKYNRLETPSGPSSFAISVKRVRYKREIFVL
jgi:hypothetical protein